jgi:hypothetical protein
MHDLDDDPDPTPSSFGLLVAALGMLAGLIFIWSLLQGWRAW